MPEVLANLPPEHVVQVVAVAVDLLRPAGHGVHMPSSADAPSKSGGPEKAEALLKPRPGGQVALVIEAQPPVVDEA